MGRQLMASCSLPSSLSSQNGSRQMWMARDICSTNQEPSLLLSMETSAARRNQRLTALEVRGLQVFMGSGEAYETGECLGAEPDKSSF